MREMVGLGKNAVVVVNNMQGDLEVLRQVVEFDPCQQIVSKGSCKGILWRHLQFLLKYFQCHLYNTPWPSPRLHNLVLADVPNFCSRRGSKHTHVY